jgi:acyl carrier protein
MNDAEILALLRKALVATQPELDPDRIDLDTSLANLGIDSVSLLEVAAIVETKLALTFPEEEVFSISTCREFLGLVHRSLPGAARGAEEAP